MRLLKRVSSAISESVLPRSAFVPSYPVPGSESWYRNDQIEAEPDPAHPWSWLWPRRERHLDLSHHSTTSVRCWPCWNLHYRSRQLFCKFSKTMYYRYKHFQDSQVSEYLRRTSPSSSSMKIMEGLFSLAYRTKILTSRFFWEANQNIIETIRNTHMMENGS